jgi:hypothetical protein
MDQGIEFVEEFREWESPVLPGIQTAERKFVVCVDLLGQDKEFNSDQKRFIFDALYRYRSHWEEFEK